LAKAPWVVQKATMEIIPVIDLMRGRVVRARQGRRDDYREIETPLSPSSDPLDVARGLLSLYPFRTLYVADLDAIETKGDNTAVLARLTGALPELNLWVDNGIRDLAAARQWLESGWGRLVLGSETQSDKQLVQVFAEDERVVLSLDFRGADFLGPPEILADPAGWPLDVIAMTLARVGSGAGPDLARLATLRAQAPGRRLYAAGGVRSLGDLADLAVAGLSGALVASALHDGSLRRSEIEQVKKMRAP